MKTQQELKTEIQNEMKMARQHMGWRLRQMGDYLGKGASVVYRYECGIIEPSATIYARAMQLFDMPKKAPAGPKRIRKAKRENLLKV